MCDEVPVGAVGENCVESSSLHLKTYDDIIKVSSATECLVMDNFHRSFR
ncbi:unnamed protein product, partial [Acanthocheilonema viteae]